MSQQILVGRLCEIRRPPVYRKEQETETNRTEPFNFGRFRKLWIICSNRIVNFLPNNFEQKEHNNFEPKRIEPHRFLPASSRLCMYVYIYIYIHIICVYIYIYINIHASEVIMETSSLNYQCEACWLDLQAAERQCFQLIWYLIFIKVASVESIYGVHRLKLIIHGNLLRITFGIQLNPTIEGEITAEELHAAEDARFPINHSPFSPIIPINHSPISPIPS